LKFEFFNLMDLMILSKWVRCIQMENIGIYFSLIYHLNLCRQMCRTQKLHSKSISKTLNPIMLETGRFDIYMLITTFYFHHICQLVFVSKCFPIDYFYNSLKSSLFLIQLYLYQFDSSTHI